MQAPKMSCNRRLRKDTIQLRSYQKKLVEEASVKNIIACLPTGAGKTVVSMELMVRDRISRQVKLQGKKIIFVVTTVQLAEQQAKAIAEYTGYSVLVCTGAKTGGWSTSRWRTELPNYEVYVIIAQILLEKLSSKLIKFDQVALMVLDECHNATKQHPMSHVMKLYGTYVEERANSNYVPRILGLTATLNKANIDDISMKGIKKEILKLEKKMYCIAVRPQEGEHSSEIDSCSTSGRNVPVLYPEEGKCIWGDLLEGMRSLQTTLQGVDFPRTKTCGVSTKGLPGYSNGRVYSENKKTLKQELVNLLSDVIETYDSFGPLGAFYLMETKVDFLRSLKDQAVHKLERLFISTVETQLGLLGFRINKLVLKTGSSGATRYHLISHKVEVLVKELKNCRSGGGQPLLGLIFVKRRSFAIALSKLLEHVRLSNPGEYDFLRASIITGTNNMKRDGASVRVTPSKQKCIMDKFRQQDINLLIATSVLEEGIDVPHCNVVVRFDEINGYTSYIQSKGRARQQDAKFLVLVPVNLSSKASRDLSKFEEQHKIMKDLLDPNGGAGIQAGEDDSDSNDEEDDIAPLKPFGPNGPQILPAFSISVVNRYIQRDIKRKYLAWWAEGDPDPTTKRRPKRGYVYITNSRHIVGVVTGPPAWTTEGAKRKVHLEVCRMLAQTGALDPDHLAPT